MVVGIDTNIFIYAEGVDDPVRRDAAVAVLKKLPSESTVIPTQVLSELFAVLVRKSGRPRAEARAALLGWRDVFSVAATTPEVIWSAIDLATDHQLSILDAIVIATAAGAGCRILLSEDMQPGFTWGGVTVVNPFLTPNHPLLASALAETQP